MTSSSRPLRRRVVAALITAAVLADAGVAAGAAVTAMREGAGHHAGTSRASALALAAEHVERGAARGLQDPRTAAPVPRSTAVPTRVLIPRISVDAPLETLSRDAKGVLQPPTQWPDAGWYANGVVPGDTGAAVLAGHLDTTKRAAVFVDLRLLRPGDRIEVRMSDHRTLDFTVTSAKVVQKALFPTSAVYGPTPDPQLRLITCSEPFDEVHGVYADNLVVFATLDH
ncbi:class F sortase [Amnibacterium sp.]|uniref:class F sortase n=1 Tax=Amnibacterium sp. TaxID=1872496 RepID=UPI002603FA6F|nr:class F sortase [Amnibacterium sp.]MCU1474184.1 class sortase [Amnibacterium sp.]